MSNAKAQTLAQRFGFQDGDLKTPKHDEIMLWLDENMNDILRELYPEIVELVEVKKVWEMPVKNRDFIIGFVDMAVFPSAKYLSDSDYVANICFEVKSKIDSLGELFRQLKMYDGLSLGNSYKTVRTICVVCPDNRFEKQIQAQGYRFLLYSAAV